MAVEGDVPLWGMQIDVTAAAEEVRAVGRDDGAKPLDDFLGSVGLGAIGEQLKDLRLSAALPCAAAVCGCLLSLFSKEKPGYIVFEWGGGFELYASTTCVSSIDGGLLQ